MSNTPKFVEIGSTGLKYSNGLIQEEFLLSLKGDKAIKAYKEMSTNDPVIGSILYAARQLIKNVTWNVEPGGEAPIDLELAEFVEQNMHDMSHSWDETINSITSMFEYGWAWHELIYKKRQGYNKNPRLNSKYSDNKIGWRKMPIRSQDSLDHWKIAEDGGTEAMVQMDPNAYKEKVIPIEKSLLFRTSTFKNNPEGRSLLRNAYRPWYFKKRIEELEGIGIERDLAGYPVLKAPENVSIWDSTNADASAARAEATRIVTNIRRDANEGVVLPFGWELTLLSTGSRRSFDTNAIIGRYDQRIAITMLTDIVMLGGDKVGSFALANVKKGLLTAALEAHLCTIADIFNKYAIPRLIELNPFAGYESFPKIVPGKIESVDLKELGDYINRLSGAHMELFPDMELENYLRRVANLPEIDEKDVEEREKRKEEEQKREDQKEENRANNDNFVQTDEGGLNANNEDKGDKDD